ncbi:MAG: cytochrome B5 [Euryarchaeota archaeon]|nr:cytochrome B5 [Euryarchaeota archaeon]
MRQPDIHIVYDGQVYDVSDSYLWKSGTYQGLHESGHDLTQEMAESPHGPKVFKDCPLAGTLKK